MKLFISTLFFLSIPLLVVSVWMFRSKLGIVKSKLASIVKVVGVFYLASVAYHLAGSDMDPHQLQVAALSLLSLAAVWFLIWLLTRSITKDR